jgi:hypothetical protein
MEKQITEPENKPETPAFFRKDEHVAEPALT